MTDMVVILWHIIGPSGEILFFYLDLLQGGQRSNFYSSSLWAGRDSQCPGGFVKPLSQFKDEIHQSGDDPHNFTD